MLPPAALMAGDLRVATLHAELTRKGPGLLLRDIVRGDDAQVAALTHLVAYVAPDVLLLTKVDVDAGGVTLAAMQDLLGYAHGHAEMPNSAHFAGDLRMGFGPFAGAGGMLLLSRHPIEAVISYNDILWRDVPGAGLPVRADGASYYSADQLGALRLPTNGLWAVATGGVTFVVFQNTTPVFDGPENRNGLRSCDQLRLIGQVLDELEHPFVAMGNANLDPDAGEGDRGAMRAFLDRRDLQDALPRSEVSGTKTAIWDDPGPMRVSYILPSSDVTVKRAEVVWPAKGLLRKIAEQASRHRLVWMDIRP